MSKEEKLDNSNNSYIDLFNNPMVEAARKNLSQEDIERYKHLGEQFYNNIDFVNGKTDQDNIPDQWNDCLVYIEEALKSGLKPSDLEADEITFVQNIHGNDWYDKWIKNKSFNKMK